MYIAYEEAERTAESVSRLYTAFISKGFNTEQAQAFTLAFIRRDS